MGQQQQQQDSELSAPTPPPPTPFRHRFRQHNTRDDGGSGGSNATECVCPQFPWEFDLNPSPRNHFHSPRIGETENQYFTFQNQIVKNPILSENVTKPQ